MVIEGELPLAHIRLIAATGKPITVISLTSASAVAGAGYGDAWLYNTNNLDSDPTWKNTGFTMVIYLAALQGVPQELYDAANVDGASSWRRSRAGEDGR